ncbi:MAG: hypothetical protein WC906_03160 [Parcubacteria group bacterium]|jgi:hypothetical protein
MHQIFYIDIDEEITSVIDRLRKSKAKENFFVVSPRSLILQSVVSLRLLKREAAKEEKQIAIVVNDKGASMKIEKAGILVLDSIKGLEEGEEIKENFGSQMEIKYSNKNNYKNIMKTEKSNKKTRLQKIGSDSFYEEDGNKDDELPAKLPSAAKITGAKPNNPVEAPALGMDGLGPKNTSDIKKEKTAFSYAPEASFEGSFPEHKPFESKKEYSSDKISDLSNMDPYKEKLVEGFFNPEPKKDIFNNQNNQSKEKKEDIVTASRSIGKIIFSFFIICLLVASGVAAYLFLPKATVLVATKREVKKFDLDTKTIANQSEVKSEDLSIPARIIEKEGSMSDSYKTTGKKGSSSDTSQKAKGKITVYNNYSEEPQQLIATTRFLSTDGKLFRIAKSITVPGMKDSNPGSVETDVIADQSGSEYNIEASDFKIPGFEGTPKYNKFYAKSSAVMSGGGSSESSGIAVVSQNDLDGAKKESEAKIKDQLKQEVKDEIGPNDVFLLEASEINISESSATARVNEVANSFDYKAKGKIKAIVFSEEDFKKLAGGIYNKANPDKTISDLSLLKISYGASSAEFDSGILSIKANVEVFVESNIDWDDFRKEILGKSDDQIKEILNDYPQIEKINIDFWPSFMSQKIPQYEKRVVIDVEKSSD